MKEKKFYNFFNLQKRFLVILLVIIILFVALICRLFFIQIVDGKELQIRASSQWLRDLPLASKRGNIVDTNGIVLASTITSYDVYFRARNINEPERVARLVADKLNLDYEKMYQKATNIKISESLIKMQVDERVALELVNSGLKGIYLSQNVKRVYPFGDMLTQVLGYCSIDNAGQTGVENYYDEFLKGVNGKSLVQANAQGLELENSLQYYLPSIDGAEISLTIDVQIQSIVETALYNAYVEHNATSAWAVMMDATNGDVLAMSNVPSFDLNNVPRDDLSLLNNMSKNSCVVDVYEPGSTFKIITLIAALNEGLTKPDEQFYCSGSCVVDGQKIKCWKTQGHGSVKLVEGFKVSCNCVFVNLVMRLGVEKLYKYIHYFGIGEKTGIDISSESPGILMKEKNVKNVDLARIGFGQSVALTPLQMVRAVGAITTGNLVSPHILNKVYTENSIIYQYKKKTESLSISGEVIELVNKMLFNNINNEEEHNFVAGYSVGGKTGTSQKFVNGAIASGKYVASFVGVYPTTKPKYILLICINEPSNGVYYGGVVAKPVGQQIFSSLFKAKNITPDAGEQMEILPKIEMPTLIGLSVADALGKLKELGLYVNVDGEGGVIVNQFPVAGTMLYAGDEVVVVTS